MKKVLHYKTNFLNKSETFIDRLVQNHLSYQPIALCYRKRAFTDNIRVFEVPQKGLASWINFAAFHSNMTLPFYNQVLRQEKPDLVHAHFGYDAVKLIKATQKSGIPLLTSFYGTDVSRLPSEFGWKRRYRKLAANAAHFIAASEFMKNQLIKLGFPEEKISIVRFGVDLNGANFNESLPSTPKVMMVGRMVEKKGFEYGIQAISNLREKGIKPIVNIYGYGPGMKGLKDLTKKSGLLEQVHFHGYQPVERILEAHHQHSLLLAPSITAKDGDMEGLPNTILEAMAQGTPVVTTRHAAIPEVIEDKKTGFLVNERDADGLADIMEKIFRNEFDLNQIRHKARKTIEEAYSIQQMVRNVEAIYDKININD
ncbi:glycosyltransferase [Rhodohalobacter sp. 614A]|uniref:glycosyltransferase n=1 Tax=Rhodohalobacter sp. 614A TaxID=2908649 RepID=UPI001F305E62|nr:glycosyltransferase [Rhodohalobacter sp. 614A]